MADATDRREWKAEHPRSSADRLIDWLHGMFLVEPVAASAAVMILVGAISNSGAVAWIAFAVSMLIASHLRKRYEATV